MRTFLNFHLNDSEARENSERIAHNVKRVYEVVAIEKRQFQLTEKAK